jgi:superfamily II DNA helicase RecQ
MSQDVLFVRASTDRSMLGYHFLPIFPTKSKISLWESTKRLTHMLVSTLEPEERAITFFMDHNSADAFAREMKCAVYHSQLQKHGNNTKGYNLWLWDSGQSKLIAATTALLQGIDRPLVKYVIFHGGTYGLIAYHQGSGRAGRAGQSSYIFVVFDGDTIRIRAPRSLDIQVIHLNLGLVTIVLSNRVSTVRFPLI